MEINCLDQFREKLHLVDGLKAFNLFALKFEARLHNEETRKDNS
jgi:hypothetical protein